jgi:hypothetical protein
LIGGGLVACASSPTRSAAIPASAPSVSVTPRVTLTPTPTPTASATPFVSAADEAGAHAFVLAYFAELDRAYATGDVSRLKPYRLDTCVCAQNEKLIRRTYTGGGKIRGVKFEVLNWVYGAHGPAFARTAISFSLPAVSHILPGKPVVVEPPLDGYYAIDLTRFSNHWTISDIRFKRAS